MFPHQTLSSLSFAKLNLPPNCQFYQLLNLKPANHWLISPVHCPQVLDTDGVRLSVSAKDLSEAGVECELFH